MPAPPAVPGVRREEFPAAPRPSLRTGVPAFVGATALGAYGVPVEVARWGDFAARFGGTVPGGYLAGAVHAFFRNGGESCWVAPVAPAATDRAVHDAFRAALAPLAAVDVDLVCAPDVGAAAAALLASAVPVTPAERARVRTAALQLQQEVLDHCARAGGRLALLDALPGQTADDVLAQRAALEGGDGALYYPWVRADTPSEGGDRLVPPCGHVAGVYARGDRRVGVHKAPANEALEGVLDVEQRVDDEAQARLNPAGVNAIRAFPGRGVRVWGARTLFREDDDRHPTWCHVPVRRVFLTLERWIQRALAGVAFEPHTPLLWARVGREATAYLMELHRRGALQGRTPAEAFYVRCDGGINPPEVRDAGMVVTEVGLAPAVPNEFVIVRFTHGAGGVEMAAPAA